MAPTDLRRDEAEKVLPPLGRLETTPQGVHAVTNGYFVGAINRVGEELVPGARFYGSSYFCDPRGQIIARASDSEDEVLVADLDLALIDEVRTTWQFYRDRRPETYGDLTELLP